MINLLNERDCCGCGACAVTCPKNAIAMLPRGTLGTVISQIDRSKCVDCGLCETVCPVAKNSIVKKVAMSKKHMLLILKTMS